MKQLLELRSLYANKPPLVPSFTSRSPNNCCIDSDGKVVLLKECCGTNFGGNVLKFHDNLYTDPYDSKVLNIGIYKLTTRYLSNVVPVRKCVCFPDGDIYVIILIPFV